MKNGNQPANPIPYERNLEATEKNGLTKREYFAGLAMQGLISSPYREQVGEETEICQLSIILADELLKQLEK